MTSNTWAPPAPGKARKGRSRTVKVAAGVIGALLAGTATYAALTWHTSRGNLTVNRSQVEVQLSAVTSSDLTPAAADVYYDGTTITPGVGQLFGAGAAGSWNITNTGSTSTFDAFHVGGFPGYAPTASLAFAVPNGDWRLQTVKVVPDGAGLTGTFAPGTAPVVAWVSNTTGTLGTGNGCNAGLTSTTPETIDVRLMVTDAAPWSFVTSSPFDVVAQWVPASLHVPGSCPVTAPTTEVAP